MSLETGSGWWVARKAGLVCLPGPHRLVGRLTFIFIFIFWSPSEQKNRATPLKFAVGVSGDHPTVDAKMFPVTEIDPEKQKSLGMFWWGRVYLSAASFKVRALSQAKKQKKQSVGGGKGIAAARSRRLRSASGSGQAI